ncbi:hypothetical protein MC885_004757 [Smutsia gigantea]|nr:hypothetical protein MC885_004757 [Smutsia gigantea]
MEMQLLLLTVGLALDCGLQGQVEGHEQEELDPQMDLLEGTPGCRGDAERRLGGGPAPHRPLATLQLSGRRHTAALASNNSALIRRSGRFRVFIDRLDMEEGDLQAQILVPSVQGQGKKTSAGNCPSLHSSLRPQERSRWNVSVCGQARIRSGRPQV